jgi:murein DD-endopeptidase MepM/ murein hydrolase activator NlpD
MQDLFWNRFTRMRSQGRWIPGITGVTGMTLGLFLSSVLVICQLSPSQAARSIQIYPTQPHLGDTVSVTAIDNSPGDNSPRQPPRVQFGTQSYPMFDLGNHQFRALIPTTPLDRPGIKPIQIQSNDTTQPLSFDLKDRSFPTQSIWLPAGQDGNVGDAEFDRVDAFKRIVTPQKFWNGNFLRPNDGEITTIYGVRRYYNGVFAEDYFHRGVDYAGDYGSSVFAPASGRISLVGYENQGYPVHGNVVGIDHGQGVGGIFLHLSSIKVKQGDFVTAGQIIGTLGDTGAATGPHLHWGLYVNGQAVDPVPWREDGFN